MTTLKRFSTANFPAAGRHEAWLNRGEPGIGRLIDARPDGPFNMWSDHLALGPVGLNFGEMTAQHYERTVERSRRDQVDMVTFCLMLEGEMRGEARDRDFVAGPGTVTMFDVAQAARHHSTKSRTVMITVPRAVALTWFGAVHELHGAVADSGASRLLRTHLSALHAEAVRGVGGAVCEPLGQSVLNLLKVTMAMAGQIAQASLTAREETLKLIAVDEITRRLDWAGLDVDYLCALLKISRTTLYRLFEPDGGVRVFIRQARLQRVYAALSNPANTLPISDLAVRWCFSDASHLSRAFRDAYDVAPSAVRRGRG